MEIPYLCSAEQQVQAKAYASVLDKDEVPHRGALHLAEQQAAGSANPVCTQEVV
jgi:hypothetical protein